MYRDGCWPEVFRNVERIALLVFTVQKHDLVNFPTHLRGVLHIAAIEADGLDSDSALVLSLLYKNITLSGRFLTRDSEETIIRPRT